MGDRAGVAAQPCDLPCLTACFLCQFKVVPKAQVCFSCHSEKLTLGLAVSISRSEQSSAGLTSVVVVPPEVMVKYWVTLPGRASARRLGLLPTGPPRRGCPWHLVLGSHPSLAPGHGFILSVARAVDRDDLVYVWTCLGPVFSPRDYQPQEGRDLETSAT